MILKEYIWTALVTAGIVVLSTIPIPENPPLGDVPLMDKWVHMVMYAGVVFVMWIDHVVRNRRTFSWAARIVMLLYAFREQLKYNPYSYNVIYYVGFALFVTSIVITHVSLLVQLLRDPSLAGQKELVLRSLMDSAKRYMLITSPFLLTFSAALCISNVALIRHEGKRFVNVLGMLLSFLLVAGLGFLLICDRYFSGSEAEVIIHDMIVNLFSAVYLYFECMLTGTIVADAIAARSEPSPDRDFMIILGCAIRKDGTPSPLLRGRIDRALEFARKQKELTGREINFVASGGKGSDEIISESACIRNYLLEQGVPEERIITEDRSTDTFENMKFSKEKILAADPDGKVAFATTNYHVFRSGLFARRVKMRAIGVGAPTRWYYWPNAAVREFVGLLTKHRGKQILVLGGLIAAFVILTLAAYR